MEKGAADISLFGIRCGINTAHGALGISNEYYDRLLNQRYYWMKGTDRIAKTEVLTIYLTSP